MARGTYLVLNGERREVARVDMSHGNDGEVARVILEPRPAAGPGAEPLVSILLPTFNHAHRVEGLLRSLEVQTYTRF